MTEKLTTIDPATAFVDDAEVVFFMADASSTRDTIYVAKCMGIVARAKGRAKEAKCR
jgi:DNA-binding phage protein